jgi:SAM-dependent methyltransferase
VTTDIQEIPLPPDDLMIAVSNHANHEDFARSRINGPAQMLADLSAAGIDPATLNDVLDFGCGCGRLLAGWALRGSHMRLHGCDYNSALVSWCNLHIPKVDVRQNLIGEPIPFDDKSFDYIYLISVFTHLTLEEQKRLVDEFRRLLRPSGYVYVSFHGEYFYPTMFARLDDAEKMFERDGFLIEKQQLEGSNDCFTLHSPESLVRLFAGFDLLKHYRSTHRGPTDAAAWQDSMIFRLGVQS